MEEEREKAVIKREKGNKVRGEREERGNKGTFFLSFLSLHLFPLCVFALFFPFVFVRKKKIEKERKKNEGASWRRREKKIEARQRKKEKEENKKSCYLSYLYLSS